MEYIQGIKNWIGNCPDLLVGAHVLVINEKGQLLLQKGAKGTWGLPGGLLKRGETLEDTARRQVFAQTGLVIGELRLVRVFSGEKYPAANESEKYIVATVYLTRDIQENVKSDGVEFKEISYFDFQELPEGIDLRFQDVIQEFKEQMLCVGV
ncbi:NUDIX domain-containing protein [Paenactinomyces guangxiensis]|uniref:NUDIX domain-containing protein n=1 Tax=Paenactinomyces guangxiensis TaxID=1490290 RepID=A0A7W2AAX8_9BACL|nr:NUDIX domain-containing protein [Paenactinomyces guangxiensis]MBA4496323.1 NUDIX domain-containing protein [Paenactinomyces guangxiensis]MBH8590852.1 NUDIX domain-containing protein [Paenactinomyces guangxiensis]